MPVDRINGVPVTGLNPDKVPGFARKTGKVYIDRPPPPIPKNPLLKNIASRKVFRDPATGQIIDRQPTNVINLYRPGGLLYTGPYEVPTPQT